MFTIEKNFMGRRVLFDLESSPIAGTFAKKLPRENLFIEMQKLGVPNISPNEGWQALALKLAEWNYQQREQAGQPLFGDQTSTVAAAGPRVTTS